MAGILLLEYLSVILYCRMISLRLLCIAVLPYYHLWNINNETELTTGGTWVTDMIHIFTGREGGLFDSDYITPTETGGDIAAGQIPYYGSCTEYCNSIKVKNI